MGSEMCIRDRPNFLRINFCFSPKFHIVYVHTYIHIYTYIYIYYIQSLLHCHRVFGFKEATTEAVSRQNTSALILHYSNHRSCQSPIRKCWYVYVYIYIYIYIYVCIYIYMYHSLYCVLSWNQRASHRSVWELKADFSNRK